MALIRNEVLIRILLIAFSYPGAKDLSIAATFFVTGGNSLTPVNSNTPLVMLNALRANPSRLGLDENQWQSRLCRGALFNPSEGVRETLYMLQPVEYRDLFTLELYLII